LRTRKLLIMLVIAGFILAPVVGLSGELKIGMKSEVSSMDPHYHNLTPNNAMAHYTFDPLIEQDEKQNLKPGLAVSWKPVNDLTWEFKLRQNVTFHDGSPFTAEDVKFTLNRGQNVPNSPSSFKRYMAHIKKVEIVDPHTIQFSTEKPFPLMATYLSTFVIVSKKNGEGAATKDYNSGKAMVGTGPFKFVEWVPGDRIVFTRNDNYWGKKPEWEKVTVKPISSAPSRVAALLAGDVDLIDFVPTSDFEKVKNDPKFSIGQSVSNRVIYLHIDSSRDVSPFVTDISGQPIKKNPLKDLRVRQAISMAINRPAIVEKVMDGSAIPAGQLLPDGFFAVSPNLKPTKYDTEGAKKLLKEAGWGDGFGLTIHGPNNRYVNDAKICQAVAQMLTRVGIKTKVETMPKNVFFPRGSKLEFSLMLVGWGAGSGEPSSPLGSLLHTYDKAKGYGASNRGRFSNKELDAALEEALVTVDRKKHGALLIKATEIGMAELGIIPLHFQVTIWGMKKGLSYTARTDAYTLAAEIHSTK
jgi:peptide/nickel transport system substrate-binding protein